MNCFQNCIFTYDSQRMASHQTNVTGCELLSELYFYLWFPTGFECNNRCYWLWIAFRIVFLLMIPNMKVLIHYWIVVVNCFQNCIFTYDSQLHIPLKDNNQCCELLSELYFYLWFPTTNNAIPVVTRCELLSELYFYLWFPTITSR